MLCPRTYFLLILWSITVRNGPLPSYNTMEYIVSARKYRPATFATVVGQRALTTTLLNAIHNGRLAHAYLFCGPRGVGKTTCARIFAKTINCLNPTPQGEACCQCESCRSFEEGRSMNIHELDAASNNSVEDIRELIEQVRIPPQGGKYKVFIIDEVHMLSTQAFNAFLKTLEEPPSYVVFILATTEKHKILPTILSRCQVYDFRRISLQGTVDHLAWVAQQEGITADPQALGVIARKADGGMRDALSIFDQMASFCRGDITLEATLENLNMLSEDYYFRLTDMLLKREIPQALLLLDEVLQKGFDGGNFVGGLASHLRNVLVARDAQTLSLLETDDQTRRRYQEQAQACPLPFLYGAIRLCSQCEGQYRQSRNKRLGVELCLIQVAQLQDDSPGSGLRPTTILNPAFPGAGNAVASSAVRPDGLTAQSIGQVRQIGPIGPAEPASAKPEDGGSAAIAGTSSSAAAGGPMSPTGPMGPIPSTPQPESQAAPSGVPRKRAAGLMSLAAMRLGTGAAGLSASGEAAGGPTGSTSPISPTGPMSPDAPTPQAEKQTVSALTQELLLQAWTLYVNALPDTEAALKARLLGVRQGLRVVDADKGVFSVQSANPLLTATLQQQSRGIEQQITRLTALPEPHMVVDELPVEHRVFLTPAQQMKKVVAEYPAAAYLVEQLGLHL